MRKLAILLIFCMFALAPVPGNCAAEMADEAKTQLTAQLGQIVFEQLKEIKELRRALQRKMPGEEREVKEGIFEGSRARIRELAIILYNQSPDKEFRKSIVELYMALEESCQYPFDLELAVKLDRTEVKFKFLLDCILFKAEN